jgi:hypothetical protein
MAAASLRCVAFAYRPFDVEAVPKNEKRDNWVLPEEELVLLGIVGIKVFMQILMVLSLLFYLSLKFCFMFSFFSFLQDPCRPGVKDAVQLCTSAGVKVLFHFLSSQHCCVCSVCAYMYRGLSLYWHDINERNEWFVSFFPVEHVGTYGHRR